MYNKYRSFQKIITIIILFFPAQKIYIDTSITPQNKPLYTFHPLPNFPELHPLPHKKATKNPQKTPIFPYFSPLLYKNNPI